MNTLIFLSIQSRKILNHMLNYSVKSRSWHLCSQRTHPTVNFMTAEGRLSEEGLLFLAGPTSESN